MKKQKLALNKFKVARLNNQRRIWGGTGSLDTEETSTVTIEDTTTNPTTCITNSRYQIPPPVENTTI